MAVCIPLLCVSCYTVRFGNAETAYTSVGKSYHVWTHSLFWGILPLGRVNIDQCGDYGMKRMKSQMGGLGLLAYSLTGGIWTPMHVKITCAGPGKGARATGDIQATTDDEPSNGEVTEPDGDSGALDGADASSGAPENPSMVLTPKDAGL